MWVEDLSGLSIATTDHVYPWLQHTGLLSSALQKCCSNLTVQVISQQIANALDDEQHALGIYNLPNSKSWVRQVYLCGDQTPWVFARVVAPLATYLKYQMQFDKLGTNLLGATFLSKRKNVQQSQFKYSETPIAMQEYCNSSKWARRSIFNVEGYTLLVTEIFLPPIPDYTRSN